MKKSEKHPIEDLFIPEKPKYWIGYPKYFIHLLAVGIVFATVAQWFEEIQKRKNSF